MSQLRRNLYRAASGLGDVEAVASGKPDGVVRRVVRKAVYRRQFRLTRKILRLLGV